MGEVPAGWYPSPDQQGLQRYWDGARWTDHVQPSAPAQQAPAARPEGWQPDPDVPGQDRFWDGSAWTDHVRATQVFNGLVPLPKMMKKKEQPLVVTTEELVWDGETIRWEDVTYFKQQITVAGGMTTYGMVLSRGEIETTIVMGAGSFVAKAAEAGYNAILGQLRVTVGERIINGLLHMVANGEPVRTGGLVFAPEGFGEERKGQLVPWPEYAGLEFGQHQGIWLELRRHQGSKQKKVFRVRVDMLQSWAIPPVVDACYQRYGAR